MIETLHYLLLALYAPWGHDLGSPHFWVRDRASSILAASWPLSEPILQVGRESPDMEVQRRSVRATPRYWRDDLRAASVLTHRHERDGIPYADYARVPPRGSEWFRHACIRYAEHYGIDTTEDYWWGPSSFWATPTGYDRLRILLRGCWPPEAAGRKWSDAWMPDKVRQLWRGN